MVKSRFTDHLKSDTKMERLSIIMEFSNVCCQKRRKIEITVNKISGFTQVVNSKRAAWSMNITHTQKVSFGD